MEDLNLTVSEYIFDFLEKKGCNTVFMVSGSSAMWLTDALKRNEKIKAVCCQHEQVAAMAADGYGRVNQAPGVCLVTIGPGATNAITGVAGAFTDSSPMFVISGQASSKILEYQKESGIRQKGTQSLCLEPLVSSITKYFAEVIHEKDIRYHMEKAFLEATTGRKGPVWIDVPIDIQNKQIPEELEAYVKADAQYDTFDVDFIKEKIKQARKPLVLAGAGVLEQKNEFLEFIETYQIPVATSRGGIGVIPTEHELFVGRPGSYGDRASHFAIQACDFLLILGSRLSVSTIGYYPQRLAQNAYKIMIDIDSKELEKQDVPVDRKIHSDVATFLDKMKIKENSASSNRQEWMKECMDKKEAFPVVLDEYAKEEGINSYCFTKILSKHAANDATVVVDTGSVCNIVSQTWNLKKEQSYLISGGLSCMGFWASAIGAASNGKTVLALSGDGSTQMNIQDFATLKYYNLPVKLFVYNNKGYLLIKHNQHNYMEDRFLGVGPDSGVPSVDFCKVAKAYDLPCVRIETKEEIEEKVDEVMKMNGPVICEVMVQEFGIIAPRIASRVMPDGSLKAAEFDDLWPFLDKNNNN